MKASIKIIILFILFYKFSFSQFYADSVTPDYVIEFMKIADEFAKENNPEEGKRKLLTNEETELIAELYYKCYNNDPVGFQKYVEKEHKQWEKAPLEVTSGKLKERPWLRVYALRDKIAYKFGIPFTEVIGTPAFLRCNYITLKFSDYHSISLNTHFKPHNFIFLVEEVLKGDKYFHYNDTISIDMIPDVESPAPNFITGKSYLIPVTTLLGHQDDGFNMIFAYLSDQQSGWVMGEPPKTFPIVNETVKGCDYFGIKDTTWTDFKKYFKETYLIFE